MHFPTAPIFLLLLAGAAPAASPAPSVQGLWLTDDHKGIVRIAPCGPKM